MPHTRLQLVQSVGERLGLVGDGQVLPPSDAQTIQDSLEGVVADLSGRGVIDYVDLNAVAHEVYPHLSALVANEVADRFGVDDALAARLAGRAIVAEQRLRVLRGLPYADTSTRVCFY